MTSMRRISYHHHIDFRIRPWLLWRCHGSRRIHAGVRLVDLAWDVSCALFPTSGSSDPSSSFFFVVVVVEAGM
jgi:hypothetical protein